MKHGAYIIIFTFAGCSGKAYSSIPPGPPPIYEEPRGYDAGHSQTTTNLISPSQQNIPNTPDTRDDL